MVYSINEIRRIAGPIAARHGVERIRLFGSYARGEATENSDIDLHIDCGKIGDLFAMGGSSMRICRKNCKNRWT